jgi:hypothetical protein
VIAALIKEHGGEIVGMFDTVQPRSFDDLMQHGFEDLPPT